MNLLRPRIWLLAIFALLPQLMLAHGVGGKDALFLKQTSGHQIMPFLYLGAKHMVTGYDHLLFLVGVIFFLYRLKDVAIYVTCFALGRPASI